jgi:DNA topoisomerase IB
MPGNPQKIARKDFLDFYQVHDQTNNMKNRQKFDFLVSLTKLAATATKIP